MMFPSKALCIAILAVSLATVQTLNTGRDLLASCGTFGTCRDGYECGKLTAQQCFTSPTAKKVCEDDSVCLDGLQECGPKAFCKTSEKCVKDNTCMVKYDIFIKSGSKVVEGQEVVKEEDCFKCVPLEFEDSCKTVKEDVCRKVKVEKCEVMPTTKCWESPERKCESKPVKECAFVEEEQCEFVKVEKCVDKVELECHDVPKQVCAEPVTTCVPYIPCVYTNVTEQSCTTTQNCTPPPLRGRLNSCERQKRKCNLPPPRNRGAAFCDGEPCPQEGTCEDVENCVDIQVEKCINLEAHPTFADACAPLTNVTCPAFVQQACTTHPPVCHTVYEQVCKEVIKPHCEFVDEKRCKKVPVEKCSTVFKEECVVVWEKICEDVDVEQCFDVWAQKCETKEVERCRKPEGVSCGDSVCKIGQTCGRKCSNILEDVEVCKDIDIDACIPN